MNNIILFKLKYKMAGLVLVAVCYCFFLRFVECQEKGFESFNICDAPLQLVNLKDNDVHFWINTSDTSHSQTPPYTCQCKIASFDVSVVYIQQRLNLTANIQTNESAGNFQYQEYNSLNWNTIREGVWNELEVPGTFNNYQYHDIRINQYCSGEMQAIIELQRRGDSGGSTITVKCWKTDVIPRASAAEIICETKQDEPFVIGDVNFNMCGVARQIVNLDDFNVHIRINALDTPPYSCQCEIGSRSTTSWVPFKQRLNVFTNHQYNTHEPAANFQYQRYNSAQLNTLRDEEVWVNMTVPPSKYKDNRYHKIQVNQYCPGEIKASIELQRSGSNGGSLIDVRCWKHHQTPAPPDSLRCYKSFNMCGASTQTVNLDDYNVRVWINTSATSSQSQTPPYTCQCEITSPSNWVSLFQRLNLYANEQSSNGTSIGTFQYKKHDEDDWSPVDQEWRDIFAPPTDGANRFHYIRVNQYCFGVMEADIAFQRINSGSSIIVKCRQISETTPQPPQIVCAETTTLLQTSSTSALTSSTTTTKHEPTTVPKSGSTDSAAAPRSDKFSSSSTGSSNSAVIGTSVGLTLLVAVVAVSLSLLCFIRRRKKKAADMSLPAAAVMTEENVSAIDDNTSLTNNTSPANATSSTNRNPRHNNTNHHATGFKQLFDDGIFEGDTVTVTPPGGAAQSRHLAVEYSNANTRRNAGPDVIQMRDNDVYQSDDVTPSAAPANNERNEYYNVAPRDDVIAYDNDAYV